MKSVIFVCLGNICRSPLAEGIAKKIAKEHNIDINIDSAGTGDWHIGEAPCEGSLRVAQMHGIDISHLRARQFTKEDVNIFDLIVVFDEKNMLHVKEMGAKNIKKLGCFAYDCQDVPDPYFFNGFDGFLEVYKMIEICVNNFFSVKLLNEEKL
ncbi:low molecular weight protein-tyrosine-phosphatase [Sulfurimonas autotrophica]|uniref:protein-tyrosine-phosphatase n=1 Tax=Sulfurimonas autotrophica (strain ATCC BAA-671 / DSM 16294 / JCM 11897 / OK10) TaxID=563040 RepID=E0UQ77_SULAO|nr:low molecular weight protein-tyrosine-phosphatase [Sulfurimonas autotrophica]ADN09820.1 protein tyrosine phosphatase [Sulfurimonas autotrophica DSM 16294]